MSKANDIQVEAQVLYTLMKGDEDVRTLLSSKLTADYFGTIILNPAFSIFRRLQSKSSAYPTLEIFLAQPDLTDEAKAWFIDPPNPLVRLESVDEVQDVVNLLNHYRKIRVSHEAVSLISKKLKGDFETKDDDFKLIDGITGDLEKAILKLRQSDTDATPRYHLGKSYNFDPILTNVLDKRKNDIIPSTFDNFDSRVKGFNLGDLVFLASRAKGGKSTVALNMLLRMYQRYKLNVQYISIEMNEEELGAKIWSNLTGIDHGKIRTKELTKEESTKVVEAQASFADHGETNNCSFDIWCPSQTTINEIYLRCKNLDYQVICVDYINLLSGEEKNMSDWEKLSTFGKELKRIAKALKAVVLVPAQLNPKDGDLKYSKALKDHANNIWAWLYNEAEEATHTIKVMQMVARGWAPFDFYLDADFEHGTVDDSNKRDQFNE